MPKYHLLALDLDGTLLDNHSRVPIENAKAIYQAQQQGMQIALCTGRNFAEAQVFNQQLLSSADWIITANGAEVYHMQDKKLVYSIPLTKEHCKAIFQVCKTFHADPCLYTADKLYYGYAFQYFLEELRQRGRPLSNDAKIQWIFLENWEAWDSILQSEMKPFVKAILYHRETAFVDKIGQSLSQLGLFELAPSVMFGGALKNMEVNCKGVHKGIGLQAVAAQLQIGMESVVAFGDSDNDLQMLHMAGLGVAMGNADAHIKEAADFVCGSNAEMGVADTIAYILREGQVCIKS